ncbi:hypothetical protein CK203_108012 [Vitis vinifera]|uniref:DUF4283 domain-containing protein n=1 Tax=Vitis vinifera TaxID=29760 RepID=A0A438C404_VITVI|nr:hypothetical protein CK203_108012 [Vitis vinifera]
MILLIDGGIMGIGYQARERGPERESKCDGGEQVNLCASEGAVSNVHSESRISLRKSSFGVESKTFEIEVEKKKGKVQVTIVERKRGVSSWIKLGPKSLRIFVECLVLCIKDTRTEKWEINWKERGRFYSLGVGLQWRRHFGVNERKESQKDDAMSSKPILGKTFAEVVKLPRSKDKPVEVSKKDLSRNLNRLAQCLVGSWDPKSVRGDDLRSWGTQMAKIWGLKGNLGLAKLERGKVLLEFELLTEAEKALKLGRILVGGFFLRLEKWSPETGCLMEGEKRREAWVRIMGLPVSLWDRAILRRVGEECGGFLAIDSQTEKLEELQWARILVKLNGEEMPNMMEIWVEGVCYSLTLWWEVRQVMRLVPTEKSGKKSGAEREVEGEGEVFARVGKRVLEEDDDTRLETQSQSANGTQGQTSGSGRPLVRYRGLDGSSVGPHGGFQLLGGPLKQGLSKNPRCSNLGSGPVGIDPILSSSFEVGSTSFGPTSLEGPKRVKALEAFVAFRPARLDVCRGPSHSLEGNRAHIGVALPEVKDGMRKQIEEELQSKERSKTDLALIEEASRYGSDPNPCGLLASEFSSSPSFFSNWTPLGEYYDYYGDGRETFQGETPLRMLIAPRPIEDETANRWELMEANNGNNEDCGKELCLVQTLPREVKGWEEVSWKESDLARFSKFLGFLTEGLEKDILDFLVKIQKRRERVHIKTLLEKSKFERELKRLECSINYGGGGGNRKVDCKEEVSGHGS